MGTLIGSQFLNAKAALYNGVDEYAYRNAPSFQSHSSGFVSFWYRPTTVHAGAAYTPIMGMSSSVSSNALIGIGLRRNVTLGNNYIEIIPRATNGGPYTLYAATTTVISAATWYHVVVKCSVGVYSIWINGVAQTINPWFSEFGGQSPIWFSALTLPSPIWCMGGRVAAGSTTYGDMRLDEVLLDNATIGSTEVAWLYNGGVPRNPHRYPLGDHWWRMGDSRDSATTIYDEIGSDHLTLVNMNASNYVTP